MAELQPTAARMSKRRLTVILTVVALAFYGGFILLTIYRAQ